jgi:molybdopterin-binding protein
LVLMKAHYRPGQVADLLGVSVDTVRRWCDDGKIKMTRSGGGQRVIDGRDLARYLSAQGPSAEPAALGATSARNRLTGIVTRVERDKITAVVELQAGRYRLVSLMTREAADELDLAPGDLAVAVVKATSVIVDVPPT